MAAGIRATHTYVVKRPDYEDVEVADVAKAEFIAGQNRVTFFDTEGNAIGSFEGSGLDFHRK